MVNDITREERDALRAEMHERLMYMVMALELISKLKDAQGAIECPKCAGSLKYSRASNGHVWGHCSTRLCLSWMQ